MPPILLWFITMKLMANAKSFFDTRSSTVLSNTSLTLSLQFRYSADVIRLSHFHSVIYTTRTESRPLNPRERFLFDNCCCFFCKTNTLLVIKISSFILNRIPEGFAATLCSEPWWCVTQKSYPTRILIRRRVAKFIAEKKECLLDRRRVIFTRAL